MHDGVRAQRARAVARRAFGDQLRGARLLLRGLQRAEENLAAAPSDAAAFGQADFGIDIVPVLADQVADAHARVRLFAGLGNEDNVAVERCVHALQREHGHQGGQQIALVVARAAAVDVAAVARCAEGREGPLTRVHLDGVAVAHDEHGALRTVAFDARDYVGARRVLGSEHYGDAFGFEHLLHILGDAGFVAGGSVLSMRTSAWKWRIDSSSILVQSRVCAAAGTSAARMSAARRRNIEIVYRALNGVAGSMRPRSIDRGNAIERVLSSGRSRASMRPRSIDRGNPVAPVSSREIKPASMRPRSIDRGNKLKNVDEIQRPWLQ